MKIRHEALIPRDLMSSPSLEDIFAQLAQPANTAGIGAGRMPALRL